MINPNFFRKDLKELVDAIEGEVVVSIIPYEGSIVLRSRYRQYLR